MLELKDDSAVTAGPPERPAKPSKLASQVQVQKKPAKTELEGTKWNVVSICVA